MAPGEILLGSRIDPEDGVAPALRLREADQAGIDRGLAPRRDVSEIEGLANRRKKSQPEEKKNLTD